MIVFKRYKKFWTYTRKDNMFSLRKRKVSCKNSKVNENQI